MTELEQQLIQSLDSLQNEFLARLSDLEKNISAAATTTNNSNESIDVREIRRRAALNETTLCEHCQHAHISATYNCDDEFLCLLTLTRDDVMKTRCSKFEMSQN